MTPALAPLPDLATVADDRLATILLEHPLRAAILKEARRPSSATEMADRLGETRQRVNYHVTRLREAGLLTHAGSRPRRGLTEHRYRATARCYVLAPRILGDLSPSPRDVTDPLSADHLLALAVRTQDEVSRAAAHATERGERLATLSIDADLRFGSPEDRADFTRELHQAVLSLAARYGNAEDGRPYRLVVGSHPVPAPDAPPTRSPES